MASEFGYLVSIKQRRPLFVINVSNGKPVLVWYKEEKKRTTMF